LIACRLETWFSFAMQSSSEMSSTMHFCI